jgi:choline dehydrogenase
MVSGIGPKEQLAPLNIDVISELPGVGQNLEDHLLFGASYHVSPRTHSALSNADYFSSATSEYAQNGTGMLSNPGGEILAWEKLSPAMKSKLTASSQKVLNSFPSDWPNFEYLMLDAYSGDNQNYISGAPKTPFMYASPAAAVTVQQSRGNVTIKSKDTAVLPVINPNWLTHAADQELVVVAFKRLREMMDTDVMRRAWVEEIIPGRNMSSDAQILDAIRGTAIQEFHAACTCKSLQVAGVCVWKAVH